MAQSVYWQLVAAVEETNTNNEALRMGVHDLKEALAHIPGIESLTIQYTPHGQRITVGGRTIEVGPMATTEEIGRALTNPWVRPARNNMSTIAEQLKAARAKLAEARQGAANAVLQSADVSRVVAQEVDKVLKEAAELQAEVAELTNGGPV